MVSPMVYVAYWQKYDDVQIVCASATVAAAQQACQENANTTPLRWSKSEWDKEWTGDTGHTDRYYVVEAPMIDHGQSPGGNP